MPPQGLYKSPDKIPIHAKQSFRDFVRKHVAVPRVGPRPRQAASRLASPDHAESGASRLPLTLPHDPTAALPPAHPPRIYTTAIPHPRSPPSC